MKKLKYNDISGKQYGRLTAINRIKNNRGIMVWRCICICGEETDVSYNRLSTFKVDKCNKCKIGNSQANRNLNKELPSYLLKRIKHCAKTRNLHFDDSLSEQYLYELYLKQNKICAISGIRIDFAKTNHLHQIGNTTASLDRINSDNGYVKDNIQWVHKNINIMKNDLSMQRFLELCKEIAIKKGAKNE
jgi:hypothetical protein